MDIDVEEVRKRWGIILPEDYLRFHSGGLLINDFDRGLRLSRFWWFTPKQIAECSLPDYRIEQLVPFAQTWGRDHFCWWVDSGRPEWIADCPRDSNFAEGIAPHFTGFVYRALLQEFSGSWLVEQSVADVREILAGYARKVAPLLPPKWATVLIECTTREFVPGKAGNTYQFISPEEMKSFVSRDLNFPMLGSSFRQNRE